MAWVNLPSYLIPISVLGGGDAGGNPMLDKEAAKAKLDAKGAQLIVANLASDGFGGDDNQALIIDDGGRLEETGKVSKTQLAERLLDLLAERLT